MDLHYSIYAQLIFYSYLFFSQLERPKPLFSTVLFESV